MTSRAELIRLLAKASHETWLRQKERDQGVPRTELPAEVSDHDLERAEDAVRALEANGVLTGGRDLHWHRELAKSTADLVEATPFMPTPKGLKAVVEVTAYRDGTKVQVVPSVVEGPSHNRTIRQRSGLMFNDSDEAKDALDAIVDRLDREAKSPG